MQTLLKKHFGYDSFRGGQEELIAAIMAKRDALGVMPTGAGKSICFQLPALMMPGVTLVVSPLISLMKDQVDALRQSGIAAAYVNSSLTQRQIDKALSLAEAGQYKLIYVAPERLNTYDFLSFARRVQISMVAVDEAHCISQWGQDFRPSYAQIPAFIDALAERPVVSAFTATATPHVRADIAALLGLQTPFVLVTGFDRQNLYFSVQNPKYKLSALLDFLEERGDKSGIIYCSTRKTVEEVCAALIAEGIAASRYHAGLPDGERKENQDDFLFDRIRVMVATNAFGMGIDKSNVGFVVHYNMPKDVESYYQEAGRAGRDGSDADCLLMYSAGDEMLARIMIDNDKDMTYPDMETELELKARARARLRDMSAYALTRECLRSFILRYFGEATEVCGHCGNCDTEMETLDITEEARKIISCVARMKGRFGAKLVIDVLRGASTKRLKDFKLHTLSTYGILPESEAALHLKLDALLEQNYLERSNAKMPIIRLGARAKEALADGARVVMKRPADYGEESGAKTESGRRAERKTERKRKDGKTIEARYEPLFTHLKALRAELAREQNVPAFVVFADSSLTDMSAKRPMTREAFAEVSGVGEAKLAKYGDVFIKAIKEFCSGHDLVVTEPEEHVTMSLARALLSIEISEEPIPIRILADVISEALVSCGQKRITAQRLGNWLTKESFLVTLDTETGKTRVPTDEGSTLGITQVLQEYGDHRYMMNMYNGKAQRFIISRVPDILEEMRK